MRILVVEDEPTTQLITRRYLEHHGHFVTVAQNGREALEAMELFRYDAVLMDIQMPVMDGFETVKEIRLREDEWKFRTPVIAYTSLQDDANVFIEAGMDAYIHKSASLATIEAALEMVAVAPT